LGVTKWLSSVISHLRRRHLTKFIYSLALSHFLKPLPVPSRIWQVISVDFIDQLPDSDGCTNIMVVTDRLSKGVMLKSMKDITAESVADWFLSTYYRQHGLPLAIMSDRGSQFVGALWARICQLLNITRRLSTAFAPETDGSTERMNQNVEVFIRSFVDHDQTTWAKLLACAELAINNREASATGVNPFFLMLGYHVEPIQIDVETLHRNEKAVSPIQKADNIIKKLKDAQDVAQSAIAVAQQMMEAQTNRKRVQSPEFREKDKVWLNLANIRTNRPSKKLDAKQAKYTVIELIGVTPVG
jgi:transposase InsO family protein